MKITVDLADHLLESAKAHAARQGTTLSSLVEQGLRRVLFAQEEPSSSQRNDKCPRTKAPAPFQLPDASVGGRGLQPEFRSADWPRIREAAYEGRGG